MKRYVTQRYLKQILAAALMAGGIIAWADAPARVCPVNGGVPAVGTDKTPAGVCPAGGNQQMVGGMPANMPPAMAEALAAQQQQAAPAVPFTGSIDLQLTQGSANGPVIGAEAVKVRVMREGAMPVTVDVKTDAGGHVIIPNVTINGRGEPIISIEHAGVLQQTVGGMMDAAHPTSKINMKLYEVAATQPVWSIAMRHVIVHPAADGLQVMEMLAVNNPTDRIWLGTQNGADKIAVSLPLPANITNLELGGGFQENYAKVVGSQIVSTLPMFPGPMQYQITYTVPVKEGAASWSIGAPADVGQLIVFAPADQSIVTVEGAQDSGSMDMGRGPMHMFRGAGIKAGQAVTLSFSHLAAVADATPAAGAGMPAVAVTPVATSNWARNAGLIGAGVVTLLGSALLLTRRPVATDKK